MYNTGTVTATANSTKLIGTGTKWLNNINRVSVEQAIQIQIGATVHNNSIQSIQSDTELMLNFPLPTAAAAAKYVILTTMVHSVSDAMNKIVSMNGSNVQFSDILTRWMTEQGIITVTLPDQTTQQLRTTKEIDKQLDGKFDKAGGAVDGGVTGASLGALRKSTNSTVYLYPAPDSQPNGYAYFQYKIGTDWFGRVEIPRPAGNQTTQLMQVGDFGFGSKAPSIIKDTELKAILPTQIIRQGGGVDDNSFSTWGNGFNVNYASDRANGIFFSSGTGKIFNYVISGGVLAKYDVYNTANTTKDANGNLKAASPIIKVFADHIELNEESEGVELEKLSTGRYKLKGTLGMNSDASWGGYHGGLVIPNGINNLPLVWADFKVEADGDIIIETHYRKHADLPPPVVLNRLITYPEFMDENGNELDSYTPCDIPNGHWIDVRVNMPSDSLYNQKQAEAQRLAEIEAERLAKEEAERIE